MRVPFFDMASANAPCAEAVEKALVRVARSGRYILGPELEAFEAAWAAYCGTAYCVGTGNALDALRLVLSASGIGAGDEVIVPANTYIATWLAVTAAGALPVPVEPEAATMNIDPAAIEAAVTPRTRAIIAVHLYGRPADMREIAAIAARHKLLLLEDAAQAHGAHYHGGRAGALGDAAAFSFYPTKNLGALGDAGAVTTDDARLAGRIRQLRNYGARDRDTHVAGGINSRMDEIQAAVLRAKLPALEALNGRRIGRADAYGVLLGPFARRLGLELPAHAAGHVYHQYVVQSDERERLRRGLARMGIGTLVHYPVPPHQDAAYVELQLRGAFPLAERLARRVLSLPIGYPADLAEVAKALEALCHA